MKTRAVQFSLVKIILISSLLIHGNYAQNEYLMKFSNCKRINDKTIQFDVEIAATSSNFLLTSYQCVFTFNNEIVNGGEINFNYVPNSSQLINHPSYGIGVNNNDNQTELTFASLAGSDSITSIIKRMGTFRLSNSIPFIGNGFSLHWDFTGIINTILTGTNFINITNPTYHQDLNVFWDTTPPTLDSVSIIDSTLLILFFSENLDSANINITSNYQISGGVNVVNASLTPNGNTVTLQTTPHALGNQYTITVYNIRDSAGNLISSPGNIISYNYGELFSLELKVFLQGPFSNGEMKTDLNQMQFIPLNQPFRNFPWFYFGSESVPEIRNDVVDWVLIELRKEIGDTIPVFRKAALLLMDGNVIDVNGEILRFAVLPGGYYVLIKHRNHIGVISSQKINFSTATLSYDFTSSDTSAYGINSLTQLADGLFGLYSGDANGNGIINLEDVEILWRLQNGTVGYNSADFDLNGGVNIADKNIFWRMNYGRASEIPNY